MEPKQVYEHLIEVTEKQVEGYINDPNLDEGTKVGIFNIHLKHESRKFVRKLQEMVDNTTEQRQLELAESMEAEGDSDQRLRND